MTPAAPSAGQTRQDALDDLVSRFRAANLDSPSPDARLLLANALGIDRLALQTESAASVTADEWSIIQSYATRRLNHEPVSRIIGERWFYGRPFRVTSATLDPRPDTETIIEAAKTLFAERGQPPSRILDIGTGTGCILLTLLAEYPRAIGTGIDISAAALDVARTNADDLRLADRATFTLGSDFGLSTGPYDLIVSNPPYIPTSEIASLAPDVKHFDPHLALDGGPDGLAVYRRLASVHSRYLSDGWLLLEVGHDQAEAVAGLFAVATGAASRPEIRTFKDLGGIGRCVAISPRLVATR